MALTARAQRLQDWVKTVYPALTFGEQEIRPIAGTDDPSEHSFGNALDIFGPKGTLLTLAEELNKNRAKWDIKVLCYDPGVGRKYDHCTTKHDDHIHADFGPHCGGNIPANGNANDLVTRCNDYQNSKGGPVGGEAPGGILGGIVESLLAPLENYFVRGALIVGGAVLGVIGVVLIIKDTELGKAAIGAVGGAVKTATTKGVVK